MRNNAKLIVLLAFFGTLNILSCKSEEEEDAKEAVEDYTKYVDSISKIATSEALTNWESIQIDLEKAKSRAEVSLENVSNKKTLQSSVDKVSTKYDVYKTNLLSEKLKLQAIRRKNLIRMELFGEASDVNDMKFEWVNKRNIVDVFKNFIETVEENKNSYSTEDWDEIKLLYDALNSRKNKVEDTGLSNSKNNKITELKLKFDPIFTGYRAKSKSDVNVK